DERMTPVYHECGCASLPHYRQRLDPGHLRRFLELLVLWLLVLPSSSFRLGQDRYIETVAHSGSFPIVQRGVSASIYVDPGDHGGVIRAARDLQSDIGRVTGNTPTFTEARSALGSSAIIIGTVGRNRLIDQLIRRRKINVTSISGKWE